MNMFPCGCSCLLMLALLGCCVGEDLLFRTLDALTRSLHYMQEKVTEINLDAVFCARKVQEQLQAYLQFQPEVFRNVRHWLEVLRDKAKRVADEGRHFVNLADPDYAGDVGSMANESKKIAWYPSWETSPEYAVDSIPCSRYIFDFDLLTRCFHLLVGGEGKVCGVVPACYKLCSQYNQRDYAITHEVMFWEAMEANKCLDSVSADRRIRLCSNVMRDANMTAEAGFPSYHQDLFMEQVGMCGFWGFRDFNQPHWLEKILEWQEPSGCYANPSRRYLCFDELPKETHKIVKRREKLLQDGCLSHETAVAMLALVVNIRFEAEKAHQRRNATISGLNALLNGEQEYR